MAITDVAPDVEDLVRDLAARSGEIEGRRRLPDDVVHALRSAGCFRMLVPRRCGGSDLSIVEALGVIEQLARADASAGWVTAITASTPLLLGFLPARTFDDLYRDSPDLLAAGALAPKGTATRVDGGWRVAGQWPFASGCELASWVYVHCIVLEDAATPVLGADGRPALRLAVFPADEVRIVDTWRSVGLRGTGSHDVRVVGRVCPDERSAVLFGGAPTVDGAVFRIPPMDQLGLFIASVAVGIAQGAVDDVAGLASDGKRPAFSPNRLASSPGFQDRLGEAYMTLLTARSVLLRQAEEAWRQATDDPGAATMLDRASLRATGSVVTRLATTVVDTAYALAGGSSVYETSPLQRRLRDIHTVSQHAVTGRDFLSLVGAVLAGEAVPSLV